MEQNEAIAICSRAQKILVLKTNLLGDVLNFLPVANFLRRASASARLSWLVTRPGYPVVAELSDVDEIFLLADSFLYNYHNLLGISSWLRAKQIDLLVTSYQEECFLINVLALLSRAPGRAGYNLRRRGWFFNIKAPKGEAERRVEINGQLLKALGKEEVKDYLYIPRASKAGAEQFAQRLEHEFGVSKKDSLCVLHLFSPKPTKSWRMEYAEELIRRIRSELSMTPVLVGNEEQARRLGREKQSLGLVNLTGQITLLELYYLLKQAGLFIGIDSFPLQLTEFSGTKAIALFGSTVIAENQVPSAQILKAEVKCAPCWPGKKECDRDFQCWRELRPEMIIQAGQSLKTGSGV